MGIESDKSPDVAVDTTAPTVDITYPVNDTTYGTDWAGAVTGTATPPRVGSRRSMSQLRTPRRICGGTVLRSISRLRRSFRSPLAPRAIAHPSGGRPDVRRHLRRGRPGHRRRGQRRDQLDRHLHLQHPSSCDAGSRNAVIAPSGGDPVDVGGLPVHASSKALQVRPLIASGNFANGCLNAVSSPPVKSTSDRLLFGPGVLRTNRSRQRPDPQVDLADDGRLRTGPQ